jgi:predicted dehydrogenase
MRQLVENLKTGAILLPEVPIPQVKPGYVLIQSTKSLISRGTEKMLLEFGQANLLSKAKQQPDKVRMVLNKFKHEGFVSTLNAVNSKLDTPLPLGYSNAGIVIEVGAGVDELKVGDRVASNGNHAEVVSVPQNLCAKIPEGVDDITASFTIVSSIGLQGIRLLEPQIGENVVVVGLGLIGLLTCQILQANGCRVFGIDLNLSKIELARKWGIEAFCGNSQEVINRVHQIAPKGFDGVIITSATKSNSPIEMAPKLLRKKGRIVLVGVSGLNLSRTDFYEKEISLQVSCSYGPGRYDVQYENHGIDYPYGYVRWTEKRNFEAVLQLMQNKSIKVNDLISAVVPFDKAETSYQEVLKTEGLGVVFSYPEESRNCKSSIEISPSISPEAATIGIIGAGNFVKSKILPLLRKGGSRVKSIAGNSLDGHHLAKKYNIEKCTTDYKTLLTSEINTVLIATPHNSHVDLAVEALNHGKHVFVEKPAAITWEGYDKLLSVLNNINTIYTVGFNRRFSPLVKKIEQLLHNCAPAVFNMSVNAGKVPDDHWIQDPKIGGGRLLGEGCHFVDLIRYLAKAEIIESSLMSKSRDDFIITLKFRNESIGVINYNSCGNQKFPKEKLEISTSGKVLVLDNFNSLRGYGFSNFSKMRLWAQEKGHKQEISAFIDAINNGSLPIPLNEILEVTRVCLELNDQFKNH